MHFLRLAFVQEWLSDLVQKWLPCLVQKWLRILPSPNKFSARPGQTVGNLTWNTYL